MIQHIPELLAHARGTKSPIQKLALRAGWLLDGIRDAPIQHPTVVVHGERIAAIYAGESYQPDPETEVIELGEATILPGLIDCHLHLIGDMVLPVHEWGHLPREELLRKAAKHAQQALHAGVTTIRDCGAPADVVLELRGRIEQGALPGPHVLCCGQVVTTPGGHGHFMGMEVQGVSSVMEAVESLLAKGVDFIKVMASGGGGTPGTFPADSQFSLDELKAMVDMAHRHGKRVSAHAHSAVAIAQCLEAGVDTIEHATFITAAGPRLDEALVARWAQSPSMAIPTTACYRNPVQAGLPKPFIQKIGMEGWDFIRLHQRFLRRLLDAGVQMAAGTDGVQVGVGPGDIIDEVGYLAEVAGSAWFGVRAATSLAAHALGLEADRGSVTVGRRADLVAVRGELWRDLGKLREVLLVVKDGQIAFVGAHPAR